MRERERERAPGTGLLLLGGCGPSSTRARAGKVSLEGKGARLLVEGQGMGEAPVGQLCLEGCKGQDARLLLAGQKFQLAQQLLGLLSQP